MAPNFDACKVIFEQDATLRERWLYNGSVQGIFSSLKGAARPLLIEVEGCRQVCGTGVEYYSWQDSSSTISTWILPMVTLMLQAPYESNQFTATLFALARWVGSPIASLSYILWNIRITGRCAVMVDNATGYDEYPDENSQYEQIRDSFYLLSVMNQYSVKEGMPEEEAEKLLRIALFSDSLKLQRDKVEDESRSLIRRRRKLAKTIREFRKRSVVPVFISLPWFLFSLVISIQAAFGQLGSNATAHNLALGLLMAWLPTLILFSIVDRNPVAADAIRLKLNRLLDAVRDALLDTHLRETYIRRIGRRERDFRWTARLSDDSFFRGEFFKAFAGQGRVRWHYGVAAPILAGIEHTNLVKRGRKWLDENDKARTSLVKGPEKLKGLHWFDRRGVPCIGWAMFFVGASIVSAFIISYYTPTVGLGCRSGGYLIFFCCAAGGLFIEGLTWWLVPKSAEVPTMTLPPAVDRRLSRAPADSWWGMAHRWRMRYTGWWYRLSGRDVVELAVLRPLEVINAAWLLYCLLAQTFGAYQTCDCESSIWGPRGTSGGYMDFEDFEFYRAAGVGVYWGIGVALSNTVMVASFVAATVQWGEQSHLATENYYSALQGLRTTRRIRRRTRRLRELPAKVGYAVSKSWAGRIFTSWILAPLGYESNPERGRIQWALEGKLHTAPGMVLTPPASAALPGSHDGPSFPSLGQAISDPFLDGLPALQKSLSPTIPRRAVRTPSPSRLPSTPYLEYDAAGSAAMSRDTSASSQGDASFATTGAGAGLGTADGAASPSDGYGRRSHAHSDSASSHSGAPLLHPHPRGRAVDEAATIEMGLHPAERRRVRSPRGSFGSRGAPGPAAGLAWEEVTVERIRRSLGRGTDEM